MLPLKTSRPENEAHPSIRPSVRLSVKKTLTKSSTLLRRVFVMGDTYDLFIGLNNDAAIGVDTFCFYPIKTSYVSPITNTLLNNRTS